MNISEIYPSLLTVKEEKFDFDELEVEEKKFDPPKRGRTRSISKKTTDKIDIKAKLERSRQSARECRARKKLRYQYLEEVISETEKAIFALRRELDMLKIWAKEVDEGRITDNLLRYRSCCIEKKLSNPFAAYTAAEASNARLNYTTQVGTLSQSPNSSIFTSGGSICMSPTSSSSLGLAGLSLSPTTTGQINSSYIQLDRFKKSPINLSPTSASHSSVSPP